MEADLDLATISTAELEISITRLSSDLNAAICRQLMMLAEFDRRNGWGHEGCCFPLYSSSLFSFQSV